MIAAEKHMGVGGKQGRKIQIGSPQQLLQRRTIKVIEIQQADLAFALCHILNDLVGLRLSQREVVAVAAPLPDQVHKGVHRKGIVLGRHTKGLLTHRVALVAAFQQRRLLQNLASVRQEHLAFFGHDHALIGAVEQGQVHFALQLLNGGTQAGLGHKQRLGRPADGTALRHLDHIFQLL